jgi:hypothetical protein
LVYRYSIPFSQSSETTSKLSAEYRSLPPPHSGRSF